MANNYTPVEDGWHDNRKPCYVTVENDHFDENSLNVEMAFGFGEGSERPLARIPLLHSATKVIVKWDNGNKSEHKATEQDQREAFALLSALFPKWAEYCKGGHTTQEMLYWFENEGREDVLATEFDIKVWHSQSGFANATVKDPRNAKAKKQRVTRADALTRAAAAFKQVFGSDIVAGVETPKAAEGDDSNIPF